MRVVRRVRIMVVGFIFVVVGFVGVVWFGLFMRVLRIAVDGWLAGWLECEDERRREETREGIVVFGMVGDIFIYLWNELAFGGTYQRG